MSESVTQELEFGGGSPKIKSNLNLEVLKLQNLIEGEDALIIVPRN